MKKWVSLLLCGTLVLSSFLAAGTTFTHQAPLQTSENAFVPIIFGIKIDVGSDGRFECEFLDEETTVNNWTSRYQNVTVNITIINPWNNTGSHMVRWRIAEYPAGVLGFISFLIQHGRVEPVEPQKFFSKKTISWSAADNNTTTIHWTIPIKIAYTDTFEFDILVFDSIFHGDWGKVNYVGSTTI